MKYNRNHKDRVFCMVFGYEKYKGNLLSLYNALNDTCYTNLDDLEITFLNQSPWQNRIKYNYREIEKEYKEMQTQYEAAALALLDDMANEIECIS